MPVEERPFDVRWARGDAGVVVSASGEIDLWSAPRVGEVLATHCTGADGVVLDLRDVSFMDSSGLGLIVAQHRRARENGFRFGVAVAAGSDVRRILEISGIAKVLELVDDPDAFLADGAR
jgi:anti-sigma B factor antagonist